MRTKLTFLLSIIRVVVSFHQEFGREKDGDRRMQIFKFNLVIFCYKEFEKLKLFKSLSQSEVIFVVYSEPTESRQVKINFS